MCGAAATPAPAAAAAAASLVAAQLLLWQRQLLRRVQFGGRRLLRAVERGELATVQVTASKTQPHLHLGHQIGHAQVGWVHAHCLRTRVWRLNRIGLRPEARRPMTPRQRPQPAQHAREWPAAAAAAAAAQAAAAAAPAAAAAIAALAGAADTVRRTADAVRPAAAEARAATAERWRLSVVS